MKAKVSKFSHREMLQLWDSIPGVLAHYGIDWKTIAAKERMKVLEAVAKEARASVTMGDEQNLFLDFVIRWHGGAA
jgi:hypothetical protein